MSWLTNPVSPLGTLKVPVDTGTAGGNLTLSGMASYILALVPAAASLSIATSTSNGVMRPDGITLTITSDGKMAVAGSSVASLNDIGTPVGTDLVVVSRNGVEYRANVSTITSTSSGTTSAPIATSSVAGLVKPGSDFILGSDGSLSLNLTTTHALPSGSATANDEIDFYSVTGNSSAKFTIGQLAAIIASINGSGAGSGGTTTPTYANNFLVTSSSNTVKQGSPVTITVTPGTGGWPPNTTVTPTVGGVTGSFSPSSTVVSNSTGATAFTFTPSSTGTASVNATVSGLSSAGAVSITTNAAATGGTTPSNALTMTNATYADRGDGSGKKMLVGGTASGSVPVTFQYGGAYFSVLMKIKAPLSALPNNSLPFIKLTGNGQSVGLLVTGTRVAAYCSNYTDPTGNSALSTDGAIHELAISVASSYPRAYVDGNQVSQSDFGGGSGFDANNLTISIDMSLAPPGLFSIGFYGDQYPNRGSVLKTIEFDGNGNIT